MSYIVKQTGTRYYLSGYSKGHHTFTFEHEDAHIFYTKQEAYAAANNCILDCEVVTQAEVEFFYNKKPEEIIVYDRPEEAIVIFIDQNFPELSEEKASKVFDKMKLLIDAAIESYKEDQDIPGSDR